MIGTNESVTIRNGRFVVRGKEQRPLIGVSSFKTCAWIAQDFHRETADGRSRTERWIAQVQEMLVLEEAVLRVFLTTEDWTPVPEGEGMFGSPPRDPGIWPADWLRQLVRNGDRPREMTRLGKSVLRWLFQQSQATGCVFELVVDATLKHTSGLTTGIIDHVIRQTARECATLAVEYPRAAILFNMRNEWNAHNRHAATLRDVNMWARRFYRWKRDSLTEISFHVPGWEAEQWPTGIALVCPGGGDEHSGYDVGPAPGQYKALLIHPRRGSEWWTLPDTFSGLLEQAHGMPLGANESMYVVDPRVWESGARDGWYRSPNSLTTDYGKYMQMLDAWAMSSDYFIIHYEEGVQADPDFNAEHRDTGLEARLREYFGGGGVQPVDPMEPEEPVEPTPSDEPWKEYKRHVRDLYNWNLERDPDPDGLEHYASAMLRYYRNTGPSVQALSYDDVRDAILRSSEHKEKWGQ